MPWPKALDNPAKPVVAIVGGSKVSTKLDVLNALEKVCDQIIVGWRHRQHLPGRRR
jgi:phosphoglycerate kinase